MPLEFSDDELKAVIMDKLAKRDCWGAKYTPVDALVNWIGKKVRRNGKRVKQTIRDMVNTGYLLVHKRGEAVSLNPARSKEIMEFIERNLR
jgi:hypothetical protein